MWVGTRGVIDTGTYFFVAVGVWPVELLACQVSMVSAAN